ncbi:hypothetical protein CDO52_00625 [Nocardiopsis gilva YIM 90087]|uniref:Uncharacterized protein n=1 Tax=Nocardiopsis gilva YIM 90087 TaxID=1235441 RepID=A0A223S019_9ACTN|nr:hypothetical protein [Nocardiopsis gilva]ASU81483.1 hypothetical protein CDO52_00625 [Nocardiopsis gilva YIM 90087]
MSASYTYIHELLADEVRLLRLCHGDLTALRIAGTQIVLDDASPLDRQDRIHALQRLAELALQAASELRTGRRDDEAEVADR